MTRRPEDIVILGLLALLGGCPVAGDDDDTSPPAADDDDSSGDDDDSSAIGDDDDATTSPEDLDGDGYSVADGDCDDANAEVHPGVQSDPCNGVDDDCDGTVDEDPPEIVGLPPGVWNSDDAFSYLADPTLFDQVPLEGWGLARVLPVAGVGPLDSNVVFRAARREDGFTQWGGLLTASPPDCPGGHHPLPVASARLQGSWTGFATPGNVLDLDGDGSTDVYLQSQVHLGPVVGELGVADADMTLPFGPDSLAAHDIDGDGDRDLVASSASGTVAFWAGPITSSSLALEDATIIESPAPGGFFGETMAVLPVPGGEPITLIGAPRQPPYGRVYYVEGWPEAGQPQPDGELDLSAWQGLTDATFWGGVIASDGDSRACIGHGLMGPAPVLCGTWAELQAGTPAIEIPVSWAPDGNYVDMTPLLVAQGNYDVPTADPLVDGRVHVRGPAGQEWQIDCVSYEGCSNGLGKGLALLPDPTRPNITWLAASGNFRVYFFALDTSGL